MEKEDKFISFHDNMFPVGFTAALKDISYIQRNYEMFIVELGRFLD